MKRLLYTLLLCIGSIGIYAQEMDALFVAMPDQYIPQLENAWRKDLVDLYRSGKQARLQNTMNGYSSLDTLTSDFLRLQVTDRSQVEMKLLPLVNNSQVLCVVTTVSGPVPDSRINFYTTTWEPLEVSDFYKPVDSEWFLNEDSDRQSPSFIDATSRLDIDLRKYTLSPDNLTLTEEYTTPLYLGKADQKRVEAYLKKSPKIYTWEKFHFK